MRREGKPFHGKLMILSVLKLDASAETRIGIVTSRRVGGAVVRNRARRRLREIVRLAHKELLQGLWLVLVARPAAATAEYADLHEDWTRLAQRSSILGQACL